MASELVTLKDENILDNKSYFHKIDVVYKGRVNREYIHKDYRSPK